MQASKHQNEAARLAALRSYDILDTPRESDFDDIVDLAAEICGTAISVINLIDADRQWFKAETGLGVRETPLETSICAHVILQNDFVEIFDTRADPRMCDNPLCLDEPGLRFYAGALLRTRDGQPIGTLCVLDHQPRTLTDLQRQAIRVLATQVMTQLDLRAALSRQGVLRSEIDHRVKNSLQSVNGFVALERMTAQSDEAKDVLQRVEQQIGTVALLHEQLGHRRGSESVALDHYLARVIDLLDRSTPQSIRFAATFDAVMAIPEEAAVLGTIVNELVTNAVKHSLGEGGAVSVRGEVWNEDNYRLTCENAIGATHLVDGESAREGLGLAIIDASARQLRGSAKTNRYGDHYLTEIECRLSPIARAHATGSAPAAES